MDHEIETVTEYPATVVGYFEERAPAEAALAELEQMDFGPLGEGFEKANIFYRDVPGQAIVSGEKRTRQNADQEEIENLPGDVAVVARGKQEKLVSAIQVLESHGAYKVSRYGSAPIAHVE